MEVGIKNLDNVCWKIVGVASFLEVGSHGHLSCEHRLIRCFCLQLVTLPVLFVHCSHNPRIIQTGKEPGHLIQPPAQSEINTEFRWGCLRICPVGSWKPPSTDIPHLWAAVPVLSCPYHYFFFFLIHNLNLSCFSLWSLLLILLLCTFLKSWLHFLRNFLVDMGNY